MEENIENREEKIMALVEYTVHQLLPLEYLKYLWKEAVNNDLLRKVKGSLLEFKREAVINAFETANEYRDLEEILSNAMKPPVVKGFSIKQQSENTIFYITIAKSDEFNDGTRKFFTLMEDQKVFAYEINVSVPKLGKILRNNEKVEVKTGEIFAISSSHYFFIEKIDRNEIQIRFKGFYLSESPKVDYSWKTIKNEFTIGRSKFKITNPDISKQCCSFKKEEDRYFMTPLINDIIKFFHTLQTLRISESNKEEITDQEFCFAGINYECELIYKL
jgi:hypothetical protein